MTKLTQNDVLKLAKLAKLDLSDDEVKRFTKEVSSILAYVEQLQKLNLDKYDTTSQVTGLSDVTRPDEVVDYGIDQDKLLGNAPDSENGYLKVRRIIQ